MKILLIILMASALSLCNKRIIHDTMVCPAKGEYLTELHSAGHDQLEKSGAPYLKGEFQMRSEHLDCYSDEFFEENGYQKAFEGDQIVDNEKLYYVIFINCKELTAITIVIFPEGSEDFGLIYEVISEGQKNKMDYIKDCP